MGDQVLNCIRVVVPRLLLLVLIAGFGYAQEESPAPGSKTPPASAAPKKIPRSADRVVMTVGGVKVKQEEFEAAIGELEPKGDPDKGGAEEKDRRHLGDDYASVLML